LRGPRKLCNDDELIATTVLQVQFRFVLWPLLLISFSRAEAFTNGLYWPFLFELACKEYIKNIKVSKNVAYFEEVILIYCVNCRFHMKNSSLCKSKFSWMILLLKSVFFGWLHLKIAIFHRFRKSWFFIGKKIDFCAVKNLWIVMIK